MFLHRPSLALVLVALLLLVLGGCGGGADDASAPQAADHAWWAGRVLYEVNVPEFGEDGTLDGVIPRLEGLAELGLEVLVLDPIHPRGGVSPADTTPAHPYAVADHLGVAPELGGMPAFTRFLAAAEARGFRVVLDMVFNHGAIDHVEMVDHGDWFARDESGDLTRRIPDWRSVADFVHADPAVRAYHQRVLKTWLARGVAGFRFLHANLQPRDYWRGVLAGVRRVDPEVYLLADARNPELLDVGFDGIYRPQFFEASTFAFLDDMAQLGLQDDIWLGAVDSTSGLGLRGTIFLEDRFLARAADVFPWPRGKGYAAALLTLPGTPKLYNGQEWGIASRPRLTRAAPIFPDQGHDGWREHYRDLLALRTGSEALRVGEARRVPASERELLVFTRTVDDEMVLVAVNFTDTGPEFTLPPALAGARWREWRDGGFTGEATELTGTIRVEPCGYRAWRRAG
jgi:glycosidase